MAHRAGPIAEAERTQRTSRCNDAIQQRLIHLRGIAGIDAGKRHATLFQMMRHALQPVLATRKVYDENGNGLVHVALFQLLKPYKAFAAQRLYRLFDDHSTRCVTGKARS